MKTATLFVGCFIVLTSSSLAGPLDENGHVAFATQPANRITRLTTTLVVPPHPEPVGTLFLWPGLQPQSQGENFLPIDNGVLQPVLTWGPSCARGKKPRAYSTWWISAQYVNTFGLHRGYTDCQGGPIMPVKPDDILRIDMSLSGTRWTQTVRNARNGRSVGFTIDMRGQAQGYAYFDIELGRKGGPHVADVVFRGTTLTFANADARACRVLQQGRDDVVSKPIPKRKGRACYIEWIVLKSKTPAGP